MYSKYTRNDIHAQANKYEVSINYNGFQTIMVGRWTNGNTCNQPHIRLFYLNDNHKIMPRTNANVTLNQ